jgi:hypothetical protein
MKACGQFDALANLLSEKQEFGIHCITGSMGLELFWVLWRRGKSLFLPEIEP